MHPRAYELRATQFGRAPHRPVVADSMIRDGASKLLSAPGLAFRYRRPWEAVMLRKPPITEANAAGKVVHVASPA